MSERLLRLAVGSHKAGSGRGCAMNVISWENGDTLITDYPACAHPFLALRVQILNDSICTHSGGDLLCAACSVVALRLAHMTVGTGGLDADMRVTARIASEEAQRVARLIRSPKKEAAWWARVAVERASLCMAVASGGVGALSAAHASRVVTQAEWADLRATHAERAALRPAGTERIVRRFLALTGATPTPPDATATATAVQRMLATEALS